MKAWYIRDWIERYEVNEKGRSATNGDKLRAGKLNYLRLKVTGRAQGAGYRRLIQLSRTTARLEACMAVFPKLLEIAADNKPELRGFILDENGKPATLEDIAFFTGFRVKTIQAAMEILTDPALKWIVEKEIPENTGNNEDFPETPGNSRNDPVTPVNRVISDTDTEQIQKHTPPKQTGGSDGDFDLFWKAYPKKKGKKAAEKAWNNAKDRPPLPEILTAIATQKKTLQWKKDKGQFIPFPATWLNQGRWDDEPEDGDATKKRNVQEERTKELLAKQAAEMEQQQQRNADLRDKFNAMTQAEKDSLKSEVMQRRAPPGGWNPNNVMMTILAILDEKDRRKE